jgi:alginate O-acetyltransferase complex protein AlgI
MESTSPSIPAPASTGIANRSEAVSPGSAFLEFALAFVQLASLVALVWAFELESRTLFEVLLLALGGFAVHAWLPDHHRLRFFGLLSVASVFVALGFGAGATLLAVGGALIALCHLPVRIEARVALVVAVGAVLMALRNAPWPRAGPGLAWPILGSMFMFRLALYLYSLRYRDAPAGPLWAIAYFFMLPNVCLPLFPVVDYKAFVHGHLEGDSFALYDRGIRWMLRGILHLLFYRLVYYDLALGGLYVNDLGDVLRHVVTTYLLYLKVSGQFHLVVGVLCMFGFRLPETNHLYFLASSFTDFWRRINIYWKDFMMKMVHYPAYFLFRRHGTKAAVVASTFVVFLATWALHAYQSYWIIGARVFPRRDVVFWSVFAVLVLVNTLWELRPGRRMAKTKKGFSPSRALTTVATFSTIAVLWSLWNAESGRTWLFMWTRVRYSSATDWGLLLGGLAVFFVVAGFPWGAPSLSPPVSVPRGIRLRRVAGRLAVVAGLLLLTTPTATANLPYQVVGLTRHLQGQGPALLDAALELRGYYETLTPRTGAGALKRWHPPFKFDIFEKTAAYQRRDDFLLDAHRPNASITFQGQPFHTNRWGMRDRDYDLVKPPRTYRVAMMGASDVLGWGVRDGEAFEARLEEWLDTRARQEGWRVEILNFAVTAVSLAQQVYAVDVLARRFSPDLVILTSYPDNDIWLLQRTVERIVKRNIAVPDPELDRLLRQALGEHLEGETADLRPFEEAIDTRLFRWAKEVAGGKGAHVALAALLSPGKGDRGNYETVQRAAHAADLPFIDCTAVWRGRDPMLFRVSVVDAHPNPAGHEVIAGCLADQLVRLAPTLGLPLGGPATAGRMDQNPWRDP